MKGKHLAVGGIVFSLLAGCAAPTPSPTATATLRPLVGETPRVTPTSPPATPTVIPGVPTPTPTATGVAVARRGVLEIRVTDAPPRGVSSIIVKAEEIEVHKAEAPEDTWITVLSDPPEFDLVRIAGVEEILGSRALDVGRYTQIRMDVVRVRVTLNGQIKAATLPSGKLKVVRPFEVKADTTTVLTLDFDADQSIVVTGKEEVLFKPVVKLLVREKGEPTPTAPTPTRTGTPVATPTATPTPTRSPTPPAKPKPKT